MTGMLRMQTVSVVYTLLRLSNRKCCNSTAARWKSYSVIVSYIGQWKIGFMFARAIKSSALRLNTDCTPCSIMMLVLPVTP